MNIEIMRNTLYKAYLDDFAQFTSKLGGATSEVMGDLLSFEVLPFVLFCLTCKMLHLKKGPSYVTANSMASSYAKSPSYVFLLEFFSHILGL